MDAKSGRGLNTTRLLGLLAAVLLVAVVALGAFAFGHKEAKPAPAAKSLSAPSNAFGRFDFTLLNQIHDFLAKEYVKPDNLDDQTLYESAIDGMLSSLDDSGTYY